MENIKWNDDHYNIRAPKGKPNEFYKRKKSIVRDIFYITLGALLVSVGVHYFLIPAGVLAGGVSGLVQGFSITMWNSWGINLNSSLTYEEFTNIWYWSLYILINIPIALWTMKKFSKNFALGSFYAITITSFFGFFFTFVPGFSVASIIPNYSPITYFNSSSSDLNIGIIFCISIISAILAAILYGMGTAIIWRTGYSSLGIGPMSRYLSNEKNISAGKSLMLFGFISSTFWIILNIGITGNIQNFTQFVQIFLSPFFISMILFLFIYSKLVKMKFRGTDKISISILTNKKEQMLSLIQFTNWYRGHTEQAIINREKTMLIFYINYQEKIRLIEYVKTIDPKAFIIVNNIEEIYGNFSNNPRLK